MQALYQVEVTGDPSARAVAPTTELGLFVWYLATSARISGTTDALKSKIDRRPT